ncbi:MAG: peptidase domain-containing ABC transporter [Legionellaceae bacterium]
MNRLRSLRFNERQRLPLILQEERAECGHACVAMISHFWGAHVDLLTLRSFDKPSLSGVNLRQIQTLFERLGFRTRALSVPLSELSCVKTPAILHWNMNHFVVLKQVKNNKVVIYDPAQGVLTYRIDEVSTSFTGVVLEVEPADHFEKVRATSRLKLIDLVKTVEGIIPSIVFLFFLSLCLEGIVLIHPLLLQYVTDHVVSSYDLSNLYVLTGGFLILMLTHGFIEYTRLSFILYITTHLTAQFSSNVMMHLLKLPLSYFSARHKGDIQSKFQGIKEIQRKMSLDVVRILLDGLMVSLNFMIMFFYSPLLSSFVFFALVLCITIRYVSYASYKKHTSASVHLHGKTASVFLETLQGMMAIKAYAKENVRFRQWHNVYVDAVNADIRATRLQNCYHSVNTLLFNLELLLVIVVGAHLVIRGHFSAGMLIAFISYRLILVNKSTSFLEHLFDYQLISIQLSRLSDIVFQKPEEDERQTLHETSFTRVLSVNDVSFSYDGSKTPVFHGLNLEIYPGEKVAIVGPSGVGKTTLLKIMMGLIKPTEGNLCLDGQCIHSIGLKKYRLMTASVLQDDTLFSGSILDNILFFDDEIDLAHVHHVAQLACIHETIQGFPMGYETLIGDMGSILSGGQKQRILLARALYKRPKLLFLDEATSHLDDENERMINEALMSLNITQIIVAHREQTIKMADRVIVL